MDLETAKTYKEIVQGIFKSMPVTDTGGKTMRARRRIRRRRREHRQYAIHCADMLIKDWTPDPKRRHTTWGTEVVGQSTHLWLNAMQNAMIKGGIPESTVNGVFTLLEG